MIDGSLALTFAIALAASRGYTSEHNIDTVRSHFNFQTALDGSTHL
jgi:hypothetical protein